MLNNYTCDWYTKYRESKLIKFAEYLSNTLNNTSPNWHFPDVKVLVFKIKAITSDTPHVFHAKCTVWLSTTITIRKLLDHAFYLVPVIIPLSLHLFEGGVKLFNIKLESMYDSLLALIKYLIELNFEYYKSLMHRLSTYFDYMK